MKRIAMILLMVALIAAPVMGEEYLINSRDWKDVYSGMLHANLNGNTARFLASEKHMELITNDMNKDASTMVMSSEGQPYTFGVKGTLENRGFNVTEVRTMDNFNLELAEDLSIDDFIIIDGSYGYNAIAVAPYAVISSSYVLFTDSGNIREVMDLLHDKEADDVIIYGHVEREVKERLEEFDPEMINNDGDRFANNVEIVKRYKDLKEAKQVLLTNGEFIESEIMAGAHPVLFIGLENVPEKIQDYIKESDIEVGVLIGNELVGTATTVRRQTGISTFVKFARSSRNPDGPISQVEGLDMFRVPKIELELSVENIVYNSLTRQLEVTVRNSADVAAYFRGTYTVTADDVQTVGDETPVFIESGSRKTVVYDLDPIEEGDIKADIFIVFGEAMNSLERKIEQKGMDVDTIDISDESSIELTGLEYDTDSQEFRVNIKNTGPGKVYVRTEAVDILVAGERETAGSAETIALGPQEKGTSIIPTELSEEDLEDNKQVNIRAYYGQRENALVKMMQGTFTPELVSEGIIKYILLAVIIAILLILIIIRKKKR